MKPERAAELLSSSNMGAFPSKLDLITQDVPYYFQQATKVFRLFASKSTRQERIKKELTDLGASRAASERGVRAHGGDLA